eukprot:413882_1
MSITNQSDWFNSNTIKTKKLKVWDGYMHKKGRLNTTYQKRWFVLYSNNSLAYFQDSSSAQATPLGEISLYSVTNIKEEQNNTFNLITSKRTFTLKCNTKSDYNAWLNKIKLIIAPNIICRNWLFKKGEKNKLWKSRYFLLCEYEMKYEIRYYEDEYCKKYKGNINCINIDDIELLSETESKNKYGKDNVLEIITEYRTYIIAGKDKHSIGFWKKQLSKILFGDDFNDNIDPFDVDTKMSEEELLKFRQKAIRESPINEWDMQTVLVWLDILTLDNKVKTDMKTMIRIQNINGYTLHEIRNIKQMKDLFKKYYNYKHYSINDTVAKYIYDSVNIVKNKYAQKVANQIESNMFGDFSLNNNGISGNTPWDEQKSINNTFMGNIEGNNTTNGFKPKDKCVQCNKTTVFGGIHEQNAMYCNDCWERCFGGNKNNNVMSFGSGGTIGNNNNDLWSLHEEIKKLKEQLNTEKVLLQQERSKTKDMEHKMNDANGKLRSEQSTSQRLRNELNESKRLLQKEKTKTCRLQKKLDGLKAAKRRKIHNIGNKTGWKKKKIEKWNNDDIQHWINSLNLDSVWNNKLLNVIKDCECNGKDIVCLKSGQEVGESFDIEDNQALCNILYRKIKALKKHESNNIGISNTLIPKFRINLFSQGKDITLNQMVLKTVRVRHIKKLYKQQSGVSAQLEDIHFYCKRKLLEEWKTLEQVGIVDERHLITVKFAADSADKTSSSKSIRSEHKCICGRYLQKMKASSCYGGSSVLCNKCYVGIKTYDFVYHCTAKKIAAHKDGYDLCENCSAKKIEENPFDFLFDDNANNNSNDNDWTFSQW